MRRDDLYHPHKYARTEEERRFLLRHLPADLDHEQGFVKIRDHYISGARLRLRRIESPEGEALVLKLGQKYPAPGEDAYRTTMTTLYLNEAEYQILASLEGEPLLKRRYTYPFSGYNASIDVFAGHLTGLILVEVESQPGHDVRLLPVPSFAVKEVTTDPFFTGGVLARLSKEDFLTWYRSWLLSESLTAT